VTNSSKSTGTAFILWLFLGLLSAHRFYLGRPVSAILQILSYFILVGFLWLLIDAFLITGMIQQHNDEVRTRLVNALRAQKNASDHPTPEVLASSAP
jgi:TM2 domain-containing membrane protein YozV